MYDEALHLSEDMTGEETDCITPAAFAAMATARGLLPPIAAKFIEPLSRAAETKANREALVSRESEPKYRAPPAAPPRAQPAIRRPCLGPRHASVRTAFAAPWSSPTHY